MAKQLQFGIVGTGVRGIHCFGALLNERSDCVIQAVCDRNRTRAEFAASRFDSPPVYTELEEMLLREPLDALIITTPDAAHEECAVRALRHRLSVLIDKPLATTVAGCRNIIREARQSGKVAMTGFNLRHAPLLAKLKQIVAEGVLGNVFLVENREFYENGRTYMARWNGKKADSGGLWIHKGCHDFDVFNWLLGFPRPRKVAAFSGMNVFRPDRLPFQPREGVPPGPCCSQCPYAADGTCPDAVRYDEPEWSDAARQQDGYVKDACMYASDLSTHDNGVAVVEYDNGARASHLECFVTGLTDRFYTVVGTLGQASLSLSGRTITVLKRWTRETVTYEIPEVAGDHAGADPGLVECFVQAVRAGKPDTSSCEQGLLATAIGQAAELSREENRVVFFDELLQPDSKP